MGAKPISSRCNGSDIGRCPVAVDSVLSQVEQEIFTRPNFKLSHYRTPTKVDTRPSTDYSPDASSVLLSTPIFGVPPCTSVLTKFLSGD